MQLVVVSAVSILVPPYLRTFETRIPETPRTYGMTRQRYKKEAVCKSKGLPCQKEQPVYESLQYAYMALHL